MSLATHLTIKPADNFQNAKDPNDTQPSLFLPTLPCFPSDIHLPHRMRTTSGCSEATRGSLQKPLYSGQCVGIDLKTVVPKQGQGEKWILVLVVCFTTGRCFTHSLNFKEATLENVQKWFVETWMANVALI